MKDIKVKKEVPKIIKQMKRDDHLPRQKGNHPLFHIHSVKQERENKKDDLSDNYAVHKIEAQGLKTDYDTLFYARRMHKIYKQQKRKSDIKRSKQIKQSSSNSDDKTGIDDSLSPNKKSRKKKVRSTVGIREIPNDREGKSILPPRDQIPQGQKRHNSVKEKSHINNRSVLHRDKTYSHMDKLGESRGRDLFIQRKRKRGDIRSYFYNVLSTVKGATMRMAAYLKKTYFTMRKMISLILFAIFLITFTLFMGVLMAFSDESTIETEKKPISVEVMRYHDLIEKYAIQYDVEEYISLIQAIMMEETQGKGNDPMQAGERVSNEVSDPEQSIQIGIGFFSKCLRKSEVKGIGDTQHLYLAIQGYNYGMEYIDWTLKHFGSYTKTSAMVYADEMKAKLKIDTYGNPEYVSHVLSYYRIGDGDMVRIALSQVGNVGGQPYWSWYGFNHRVEWCACFVSWVANEAGLIDQGFVPKFAYCPYGVNWFKNKSKWLNRGNTPEEGYIIFFDFNLDGTSDHVGIVEYIEDGVIHTIEGNSIGDECRQRRYDFSSSYIVGYGITV